MRISDVQVIDLPKFEDRRGNITSLNNGIELPFDVKRVFYLYDIPGGESRGAHAHKECYQFLVAASGGFTVAFTDGNESERVRLSHPDKGVLIPPGIWASEEDFTSGAICLVLASETYSEDDYLREYSEFTAWKWK